ncbi:MAG: imidazole glycerol phosphate synthase subunit HisH [Candidatus Hydrogenedentes bacterium]|nr:imidazole glycerol phosphate synthase subunit HisH [Candidatus Hydrogenedentota bacterium]
MSDFSGLNIGIVDYSVGNLMSVRKMLERLGVNVNIIGENCSLSNYDGIILPGVGSCDSAMRFLKREGLDKLLDEYVMILKKPVLGICLGFQLMCEYSEEGEQKCLGWVKGVVKHFKSCVNENIRVPHIGWNEVRRNIDSILLKNLLESPCFYFAHSYMLPVNGHSEGSIGITTYYIPFVSVLEYGNIFGVQFHPEKSYVGGEVVFRNFLERVRDVKG